MNAIKWLEFSDELAGISGGARVEGIGEQSDAMCAGIGARAGAAGAGAEKNPELLKPDGRHPRPITYRFSDQYSSPEQTANGTGSGITKKNPVANRKSLGPPGSFAAQTVSYCLRGPTTKRPRWCAMLIHPLVQSQGTATIVL